MIKVGWAPSGISAWMTKKKKKNNGRGVCRWNLMFLNP